MHLEKRAYAERDRCEIEASLRLEDGTVLGPCLVVDITEQGAGLCVAAATRLPQRFVLALPLTDEHQDERLVDLRWRKDDAAGVRFVKS